MGTHGFKLVFFVLFLQGLLRVCLCTNSSFVCVEKERQALLKLKHSFLDPSNRLSSWRGKHCCRWIGIGCDAKTGHVTKLDLRLNEYKDLSRQLHAREVDASLVELQELRYLDLGKNDFRCSNIPAFFGSMPRLEFLGLSQANFAGPIPVELGNLTTLQVLHLKSGFSRSLQADSLEWASNLVSLRYLDMSGVNMTNVAHTTIKVLSSLPILSHLKLSRCELEKIHFAHLNSTLLTSLEYLDLSDNSIQPQCLGVLRNMTSLRGLDLSYNSLDSSIPSLLHSFKSLLHLNLAHNTFDSIEGGLLSILDNACSLKSLDLSGNLFVSKLLDYGFNSSSCAKYRMEFLDLSWSGISGPLVSWLEKLKSLKFLDLHYNSFYGSIPPSIRKLSSLTNLDLSYNQLNGTIPETLGDLSLLSELDLSRNKFSGSVPKSLGILKKLEVLDVTYNSLEGIVTEVHLYSLSRLRTLGIGFNHNLTLKTRSNWIPVFSLNSVNMAGCKVGPQIPQWLRTQNEVIELYLSNANINDSFPSWLHGMTGLLTLSLSMNAIRGPLPTNIGIAMPGLQILKLGSNFINDSIPKSLCLLSKLFLLDLSKNMLSGEVPNFRELDRLVFINLSENKLSGTVPNSIGYLPNLASFRVCKNNLSGELPSSLANNTILHVLDVGENQFSGVMPQWTTKWMIVLRLRNNMFSGNIPPELCTLSLLSILDLANNRLGGEIPRCFNNLTGMTTKIGAYLYSEFEHHDHLYSEPVEVVMKGRKLEYTKGALWLLTYIDLSSNDFQGVVPDELCALSLLNGLNLSHNRFSGNIPDRIGNLNSLESLDLSDNHLSGVIPSTLASLTMLAFLNMSFNNLSGQVPSGNQLQTLDVDPSIYAGNPLLCGPTLPNKCSNGEDKGGHDEDGSTEEHGEDDKSEKIWLYFFIALGYATGLWLVIGTLFLNQNWRIAYFRFAENARDRVTALKMAKLFNNTLSYF